MCVCVCMCVCVSPYFNACTHKCTHIRDREGAGESKKDSRGWRLAGAARGAARGGGDTRGAEADRDGDIETVMDVEDDACRRAVAVCAHSCPASSSGRMDRAARCRLLGPQHDGGGAAGGRRRCQGDRQGRCGSGAGGLMGRWARAWMHGCVTNIHVYKCIMYVYIYMLQLQQVLEF